MSFADWFATSYILACSLGCILAYLAGRRATIEGDETKARIEAMYRGEARE